MGAASEVGASQCASLRKVEQLFSRRGLSIHLSARSGCLEKGLKDIAILVLGLQLPRVATRGDSCPEVDIYLFSCTSFWYTYVLKYKKGVSFTCTQLSER